MKRINKTFIFIFAIMLIVTSVSFENLKKVEAYTVYNKMEIENMQLNKARIKSGSADSNGKHVETYWQQDPLDSFDKLTDITFARTVLDAGAAGEYMLQIHCKNEAGGSITAKLYVNGTAYDVTISGSSYQTVNKTVEMKKGKNSIVFAWVNWGYFDYINYPSELKPVSQSTSVKYYAFESALNEVQLTPTSGFHSPETILYTAPIEYNSGDAEWQGSATFTAEVPSDIKSVDLHYYVESYSGSNAQMVMSVNGGKEVKLDLSGTKTNTELTYSIAGKTLESAGFKTGKTNTIKFRQASSTGGKVGLYYIELKKDNVEEVTTVASVSNRYEAEDAYEIAGARIKSQESEDETWSKKGYVGEFTASSITKPSQIDEYCSNIGYIQYRVNADKAGYYKVTLGYATEKESMAVYVTSGYEWSKVTLTSTDKWSNVGEKYTYVFLKKGSNKIWVTGTTSKDDWVNYDYIDVEFDDAADIDTSKTVLLLDGGASGSNSKVVSKDEETTKNKEDSDVNGDEEELSNDSQTSPQTGASLAIMMFAVLITMAGAIIILRRNKVFHK